ncbi:MAG TPA: SDR family NAD(P)-dependent oxidoreductase, partial [Ktedonobacteraceae bacterium]|nr:SDR family NAD(P)-dependent oxidoreductase [Ktedonobacteraceae bacterium]
MCKPVRFADGAGILLQNAEWLLLEVGPGQSLSSFIRQHPACSHDRLHLVLSTLPSLYERQSDLAFLLTTLGKLWLAGVSIDWMGFYTREQRYRVPLPTYPFERQRHWIEASKIPWNRQQSAPVIKGKKPDPTDWFYLPSWEQAPLLPAQTTTRLEQSPYLVFADSCGLGDQLALRLRCQGAEVVVIRPGERYEQRDDRHFVIRPDEKADYLTLCKALGSLKLMPRTVLHCWPVTQDEEEISAVCAFHSHQQKGLYSLLYLTQAFGSQVYEEPVQVVLISNHMQAVTGQELIQPGKATALGACKIVPQEHLNITCRSIDLSLAGAAIYSDTHLLRALVAELTSSDLVVAYRGRTRWVQVYRNICLSEERRASTKLRERGVYLITGGLGNVGLVVAKYLAREVQARLVIVGRSVLPERSRWSEWLAEHEENHPGSVVIRALQAIEELGSEVLVISADVADSQQLASVFAQIEERFGALHGVIHAAGSSDPAGYQTVQDIDSAACELHFRPKAYGLFALEQELQGLDLDFCVLFSSVSAMLGGLGFTGYAAANIFMDAFVQKHNAEAEVPWISVNWDTWLVKENVHGVLGSTIADYVMTPEEGTEVFARAIASGIDQLVISTGDLETRLNQWIRKEPAYMLDQAADATSGAGNSDRPNLSTPYVAASTEHEQKVIDIWQQVLGINQIGIHDNFFELGGHS